MMRKHLPLDFWSVIAVDGLIVFFAIWTVCCHALLFFGGNTYQLLYLSGTVFVACAVFFFFFVIRRKYCRRLLRAIERYDRPIAPSQNTQLDRIAGLVGLFTAAVILLVCNKYRNAWLFWSCALGFALLSGVWLLSRPAAVPSRLPPNEPSQRWQDKALWVLALIAAYVTLIMKLPNSDDSLYVHIAVAAADRPFVRPIVTDTIHNSGVPPIAVYRVHSYELLAGVISLITGIPAIKIIHLGFAGIAGLLTPLAWARLFRLLDPRRWFWMVLVVFCWYLADGTTAYSPPMHAFARLFQGKAILLTIGIPLIAAYGIRFGLQPCWKWFWMFVAAQVAAVGLSSTGLWVAPVVAMVSVCVPLRFRFRELKVVGLGLLSCFYVIGIALWIRTQMSAPGSESMPAAILSSITQNNQPSFTWIKDSLRTIFGVGTAHSRSPLYYAYSAVLLLSWPLARTQLAKRYIVAFGLVFVSVLANPFLYRIVIRNLTSGATYNRIVFILPTAVALAVCFTSILYLFRSTRLNLLCFAISAACLYLFFIQVPRKTVITAAHTGLVPTLKVSDRDYEAALDVTKTIPPNTYILSAGRISMYLPMVHHHPYMLMVKPKWFSRSHPEKAVRFRLRRIVDGKRKPFTEKHRKWFLSQLDRFHVEGVVSSVNCTKVPGFLETMEIGGFHLLRKSYRYHIWRRKLSR